MNKLIIALDNMTKSEVKGFIFDVVSKNNNTSNIIFKVNDLLADIGFEGIIGIINELKNLSVDVSKISWMIDGKWNDIPNTIGNYVEKLHKCGLKNIDFLTIMASAGEEALKNAVERKKQLGLNTKILAVTILTSMSDNGCYDIYKDDTKHSIIKLAKMALNAGVDGLVCSPNDAMMLKSIFKKHNFELVTPGIRIDNLLRDDQNRINTPEFAILNGCDHLVVGRPITKDLNPNSVIENILSQMKNKKFIGPSNDFALEYNLYQKNWEDILKYIGAIYLKGENGKYVRLASKLLSDGYINIGVAERNFRVLDKAGDEIRESIIKNNIQADLVMGAQMGSVRFSSFLAKSLCIEESVYTEKDGDDMKLKRHEIELSGRKIILCEDVVTKGSTITKMIEIVKNAGGEVVGVASIVNRTGSETFEGIPLFYCYKPKPFNMFYDENTPEEQKQNAKALPNGAQICEKPKNSWGELVMSMR